MRILYVLGAAAILVAAVTFFSGAFTSGRSVLVYTAPTLSAIAEELKKLSAEKIDVQVYGSVFAANLIKSGKIPDLFLSVDKELRDGLNSRSEKSLGTYSLQLVCVKQYSDLGALEKARIGVADPNQSPVGYRALAAMYLLAEREGVLETRDVEEGLNVKYVEKDGVVEILAQGASASNRFFMRQNLEAVFTLLEAGLVDCIFTYTPFTVTRNLGIRYNVIELPDYASFKNDPDIKMVAKLIYGDVRVAKLEAVALSFSEKGEELQKLIEKIDLSKHGLTGGIG